LTRTPGAPLAARRNAPFATTTTEAGARRLAAVNASAAAAGLTPGLPLAEARALRPDLALAPADATADRLALERLARWAGRWTPSVAIEGLTEDGGAGLWLDITGCEALFGGEDALADAIVARIAALGLTVRLGLADTPGAAWAAARFLDGGRARIPPGAQRQLLGPLPLAALRLPAPARQTLARLGLRTVADLLERPRAPLGRRVGPRVRHRLDQLLGTAPEPLAPLRPVAPARTRLDFAEPIGTTADVVAALDRLLAGLLDMMERRGRGPRALRLTAYRVDGSTRSSTLSVGRPTRDAAHLARLFRDRLEALDAGFGIETMTLEAPRHQPLRPTQTTMAPAEPGRDPATGAATAAGATLGHLLDRLVERCGADNVVRLAAVASHRPERAQAAVSPDAGARGLDTLWPGHQAPRPVRLLRHPQTVPAPVPPPHPLSIERIGAEWWRGPAGGQDVDLLRVEDGAGVRLWIARDATGWTRRGLFP
jgi:protein ImuB